MDILAEINTKINNSISYEQGKGSWTAENGIGDCRAFAAAKYMELKKLGIPAKMVFVQSNAGPHVVVEADGKILDSYDPEVLPVHARKDLSPAYWFDDAGVYEMNGNKVGSTDNIPGWDDYLKKSVQPTGLDVPEYIQK